MNRWPLQKNCDTYYGNPRGKDGGPSAKWESANLTTIKPPYRMTYAGKPISGIRVHKKCAESLLRVLNAIWDASGRKQAVVDAWGASIYGGAYNYRLMRGGSSLSMHSWGCAIDLDPANNGLGDSTPKFAKCPEVLAAFAAEGWEWGGSWSRADGMHWQASWTRADAVKPGVAPAKPKVSSLMTASAPAAPEPAVASATVYTDKHRVSLAQTMLRNLGYTEIGEPNGVIGEFTKLTVRAYRARKGLPDGDHIDDALMAALATDDQPRQIAPERANATPAEVRAKVPEVHGNWLGKITSNITTAGSVVGAAIAAAWDKLGDAKGYLEPIKDFAGDVPVWLWLTALAGGAFILSRQFRKGEVAGVEATQTGARR